VFEAEQREPQDGVSMPWMSGTGTRLPLHPRNGDEPLVRQVAATVHHKLGPSTRPSAQPAIRAGTSASVNPPVNSRPPSTLK